LPKVPGSNPMFPGGPRVPNPAVPGAPWGSIGSPSGPGLPWVPLALR